MPKKTFVAIIRRAHQIGPDQFDVWEEAFEVEPGETVEDLVERIKKRAGSCPDTIKILPLNPGAKQWNS